MIDVAGRDREDRTRMEPNITRLAAVEVNDEMSVFLNELNGKRLFTAAKRSQSDESREILRHALEIFEIQLGMAAFAAGSQGSLLELCVSAPQKLTVEKATTFFHASRVADGFR